MSQDSPPILECSALSKSYGEVKALIDMNMTLQAGEVRALLGKNGAGKSTLVNLLSGSQEPEPGAVIKIAGEMVRWTDPADARRGGVAVVHQEFSLVPTLTVAENITLGHWPQSQHGLGFIDNRKLLDRATRALEKLGEPIPLRAQVGHLSIAQQQMVEIAKALDGEPRVLILDEPSSALNINEVETLLSLVRRLAAQGVAVIYVSHRMKEIPQVADTLTVLLDGREVETSRVEDVSTERVAALIAGESGTTAAQIEYRDQSEAPVVLSVQDLTIPNLLNEVSFDLHRGEVLGIAGLLGSGRTELLESIYGLRHDGQGDVILDGVSALSRSPRRMLARKLGMTPEDRKESGIIPMLSVSENLIYSARGRVLPTVFIRRRKEAAIVRNVIQQLDIKASSPEQLISTLSGGNQQKGVIGRLLAADMDVLLLDEPTRGVDLHAKAQLYILIRDLALKGVSSIFVSSELDELSEVCDRILVLRDGRIADEVVGSEATAEILLGLAMKEGS